MARETSQADAPPGQTLAAMLQSSNAGGRAGRGSLGSGRELAWFHSHSPLTEHECWTGPTSNPATATAINCAGKNLQGPIPPLDALTALTQLLLGNNRLEGPIPPLDALTALTTLYLRDNQLEGPIPPLDALTSLTGLYLYNNQLEGPIPPLDALTSLTTLKLYNNQLQGPIPPLDALTSLTGLYLKNNQLEGPIPPLSALNALTGLWLNGNRLSGALPDLSHLPYLRELEIQGNELLGRAGTECADPTHSANVLLAGAVEKANRMGLYTEVQITDANDYAERDGRPAFYCAAAGSYLYYDSNFGDWNVGQTLGSTAVSLYAFSTAAHPLAISAQWKEVDGSSSLVDSAVTLSCPPADRCAPGSFYAPSLTALFASIDTCEGCSVCMRCAAGRVSPRGGGAPCEAVPVATYSLENASTATPCPAGTYGNVVGLGTVECAGNCAAGDHCPPGSARPGVCRAGFYCPDSTVELPCAAGSVSSKGAVTCEACAEGKRANADRTLCELCALGAWAAPASSSCSPCPGGRYGGALGLGAADECTACDSGKFSDGSSACALCPAGTHSNANLSACEACPFGRHSAFTGLGAAAECTPCVPGRFGVARGARSAAEGCDPCGGGTYQEEAGSTECQACPSGRVSDGGLARCQSCDPGTVPSTDRARCDVCEPGFSATFGSSQCSRCAQGTVAPHASTAFCEVCPQGYYADQISTACLPCPAGSRCVSGTKEPCEVGKSSPPRASHCEACAAGRFLDGNVCEPCLAGTRSAAASSTCNPCAAGRYSDEGAEACEPCPKGTHGDEDSPRTSALAQCSPCPPGTYSGIEGLASIGDCSPCFPGTIGASPGATSILDGCSECQRGEYSDAAGTTACKRCAEEGGDSEKDVGSTYCKTCLPGSFYDLDADPPTCRLCAAGTFTNASGMTHCSVCTSGTSPEGASYCEDCSAGTFYDASLTAPRCAKCAAGTWSRAAASSCTECVAGRYSGEGAEECEPCPKGKHGDTAKPRTSESVQCSNCLAGTYGGIEGLASIGDCSPCLPGTAGILKGAISASEGCELCGPGTFTNDSAMTECISCASGTSPEGATFCEVCTAGKQLHPRSNECRPCSRGQVSASGKPCRPCPPGEFANNDRTECDSCPAGRWGASEGMPNENCTGSCAPGTYSFRGMTACLTCEGGKYAASNGSVSCSVCDELRGFTSEPGAAKCVCSTQRYLSTTGACVPCKEGMECSKLGNDIQSLDVNEGFYRPSDASVEVVACPVKDACVGGSGVVAAGSCRHGNEGVLCAICSPGFYRPSSFALCTSCGDATLAVLSALGVVLGMAICLMIFIFINRRAPSGLLRPFINLVQQLTVMLASMFDAPFPDALVDLYKVLAGMSLGLDVASPQCAGVGSNFYVVFLLSLVALGIIMLLLMAGPILTILRNRSRLDFRSNVREVVVSDAGARAFRDVFVVVLLLHPTISGKAMEFFRCRTIDGVAYLMADYSLVCYDGAWFAYLFIVLLVLVLFSLGTPAVIAYVLYARRLTLYEEDGKPKPQPLDILYAIYRKEAFWYESVQMVFKLALWSTLVFFEHGSEMQLAAALVVNVLQLCVHIEIKPMGGEDARLLNTMQTCTLVLTTYINFGALSMNYLEVSKELAQYTDPDNVGGYDGRIVAIGVLMEVLTFGLFLSFGGVVIKKAFFRARATRDRLRSHGNSAASPRDGEEEAPRLGAGATGLFGSLNPMMRESTKRAGASARPATNALRSGLAVELTSYRSKRPLSGKEAKSDESVRDRQVSVDLETEALPAPSFRNIPSNAASNDTDVDQGATSKLPPGWSSKLSPQGIRYYYCTETRESSWEPPPRATRLTSEKSGHGPSS